MTMIDNVKRVAKAIVGGVTTGAASLIEGLADGRMDGGDWLKLAGAVLVGSGLVYAVPNAKPAAAADEPAKTLGTGDGPAV